MATFNGTQLNDSISGTNDDDIITGLDGSDVINGAGGNDDITGGGGDDNILGGAGDDTINGADANDTIDGGDDTDTLVTDLANLDDLTQASLEFTVNSVAIAGDAQNLENVQVSNASDFVLDLTSNENQVFAFDTTIVSQDFGVSATTDILAAVFNGATDDTIAAVAGSVLIDEDEGIVINGTTYMAGDTYTTAGGGTVAIAFDTDRFTFAYTAAPQSTIEIGETVEDEVLDVQMTDNNGNVIDVAVTLNNEAQSGTAVDLSSAGQDVDTATRVVGDDANNTITDGAASDTLIGNGGSDTFNLQSDADNSVWAGADDNAADTVNVNGDGNNTVGLGVGNDIFNVGVAPGSTGDGNNTLFGGDGTDTFNISGDGNNAAWGGSDASADTINVNGDGNNTVGGGEGLDTFNIAGDGDNTIFAGADDANDDINITGNGNNTVFGGQGEDGTGVNDIDIFGTGDNIIFNGNGNDTVTLDGAATGNNTLYGGAGDDDFTFNTGSKGTVIFEAGNGNDEVLGLDLADTDQKVDLSAFGFADADAVLAAMSDNGVTNDVDLFITAGQVISFDGLDVADFQAADPADWLIL